MHPDEAPTAYALIGADGRWLAIDPAYVALLGVEADAAGPGGRPFADAIHADDRAAALAMIAAVRTSRTPASATFRHLRADGRAVSADLHAALLSGAGDWLLLTCRAAPPAAVPSSVERHWHMARLLVQALDSGKRAFGTMLIGNPATEILLHAYLAEAEGVTSDAADIVARIGISWPIGHRWLRVMLDSGLVETETPGPIDRLTPIRLTPSALALIESIFGALSHALAVPSVTA